MMNTEPMSLQDRMADFAFAYAVATAPERNLYQDVADHWDSCLDVNSSWREFTNELGILNTLGILDDCNYEFVIELLQDTDEFADEDYYDLALAVEAYLVDKFVSPDYITANDLITVAQQTGFDDEEIADFAREAGVAEEEIEEFANATYF